MSFYTLKNEQNPIPVTEKRKEFVESGKAGKIIGKKLKIAADGFREGVRFCNPGMPFEYEGKLIMPIRCSWYGQEDLDETVFFERGEDDVWRCRKDLPHYMMQDPYWANVQGKFVLGGVKAWREDGEWIWFCQFFTGDDCRHLRYQFPGPMSMKDIRLAETNDGRVAVFTRPQGIPYRRETGHIADIGYIEADSLDDLNPKMMTNAPVLKGIYRANEWGGVNHVYKLKNGLWGILGHIAFGDTNERGEERIHYSGTTFAFDPKTRRFTEPKIIIMRRCFDFDHEDLREEDVIFSGGLVRKENGKATVYCGVGDKFVGEAEIDDPFVEYENMKVEEM